MRILLAEDDPILGEAIQAGLEFKGDKVDWVKDGISSNQAIKSEEYDCVILDLGLPRRSGLDVLDTLRREGDTTPILILTALDAVANKISGLDKGADDYLTKPFDMDELAARLRALVRRNKGRATPSINHGEMTIHPDSCQVIYQGESVDLSRSEYMLLVKLVENAGKVYSQQDLESTLYSWDGDIESNTVQVYIHNIRKKTDKQLIRTIRGIGYIVDKTS